MANPDRFVHDPEVRRLSAFPERMTPLSLDKKSNAILSSKCRMAAGGRGVEILHPLNFSEWEHLVHGFVRLHSGLQFIIGDLIAYGEERYERGKFIRAAESMGYKAVSVEQWASVCRAIPPDRRTYNLSFTHYHEATFNLDSEQQEFLLSQAEMHRWSVQRLRREAKLRKAGSIPITATVVSRGMPSPKLALPDIPRPNRQRHLSREQFGPPIHFDGFAYAPINEQGVILLFGMLCTSLGIRIEGVRAAYPDCIAKRRNSNGKPERWETIYIEFEYRSSNFRLHKHDAQDCDLVVCWEDDWPRCPIPVLELKAYVQCPKNGEQ